MSNSLIKTIDDYYGVPFQKEMQDLQERILTQITENVELKVFELLKERLLELKGIEVNRISDLEKHKDNLQTFSFELEDGSVKFDTFFGDTLLLTIVRDFKMEIQNFNGNQPTTITTGFKYY